MTKKALIVGINEYPKPYRLSGCVNDAKEIQRLLVDNGDGSHNFDTKPLLDSLATKTNILNKIDELFDKETDVALFYFSGHGSDDKNDGFIISCEGESISFAELIRKVNGSKSKYKIVILDCCYSGKFGCDSRIGDKTALSENTVILTACSPCECAIDDCKSMHGTFTKLLIGALEGGASDVLGRITAGSIYAYIDQALGAWEQRPYFKANVSSFSPIREIKPKIDVAELKKGLDYFEKENSNFILDPSFEETNFKGNKQHKAAKPYAKDENVQKMKILQKMNRNGLVVPRHEEFMYFAAMHSDAVQLTCLGRHYWNLHKKHRI